MRPFVALWTFLAACSVEPAPVPPVTPDPLARVGFEFLKHIVTVPLDGSLANDPVIGADVRSAEAIPMLEALAYCALDYGESLTLEMRPPRTFPGWLGAWPEWADGPCEEECQEAITGCMMAKTNVYGIQVEILFLGDVYPQGDGTLGDAYPIQEGAFFGNYFTAPQKLYTCVGDGIDPFHRAFRTCTLPGNACHFQHIGACGSFDGAKGQPATTRVCDGLAEGALHYVGCHDRVSDEEGVFPADAKVYRHATTVNIRQSNFMPGSESCFDP